jgi:RimJ/RimL family protein N-acetyltransferase
VYRFYLRDGGGSDVSAPALPDGYQVATWLPARDGLPAAPLPTWPNAAWWALDRLRVLHNRGTGVLMIVKDGRIAHRSLVTAGYFRFPEMRARDLQIGDTWTDPQDRGRGLATAAIDLILNRWAGRFDRMWYIVEDDNAASIRVIEKAGFALAGTGARTKRYGLRALGQFRIVDRG